MRDPHHSRTAQLIDMHFHHRLLLHVTTAPSVRIRQSHFAGQLPSLPILQHHPRHCQHPERKPSYHEPPRYTPSCVGILEVVAGQKEVWADVPALLLKIVEIVAGQQEA